MLKNIRRAYSYISLEQTGALSILKFNRPKKYNAINPDMYDEIGDALRKEKANDSSSLLAITGEGSYYSSGNDLTAFAKWMAQVSHLYKTQKNNRSRANLKKKWPKQHMISWSLLSMLLSSLTSQ